MELNKQEKLLIEAVREMDFPSYNVLLWFVAGLEQASKNSESIGDHYRVQQDQRLINIARSYMREM
jgi:hypothetical protein